MIVTDLKIYELRASLLNLLQLYTNLNMTRIGFRFGLITLKITLGLRFQFGLTMNPTLKLYIKLIVLRLPKQYTFKTDYQRDN